MDLAKSVTLGKTDPHVTKVYVLEFQELGFHRVPGGPQFYIISDEACGIT